ncbi:hypothetical protein BLNAU_637 [Blattamonas nauphoetae]|uniref:TmcB/TmcC TPR repeats domain-containing protein n=1 Tax=Blattamonas nauphoetae TaxID=2049346 RepID=A0ABQ9YK20_9EUKA|nr:hypothetical protein BLNAU_637 [Blattamonas nauphoetae]
MIYPLVNKRMFPRVFRVIFLALNVIQWVGLISKYNIWPLSGVAGNFVISLLQYFDLSITFSSDLVHFVVLLIILALYLLLLVMIVTHALLTRHEKPLPRKLPELASVMAELFFNVLAIPIMTISGGAFHFAFVYKLFAIDQNVGRCEEFCCQQPIPQTLFFLSTLLIALLSPFLVVRPLLLVVICLGVFFVFCLLFTMYQPFFSLAGNALSSSCTGFVLVLHLSFLVSLFVGPFDPSKPYVPFVLVLPFLALAIAAGVGLFFLTSWLGRRLFAMNKNDGIPIIPTKASLDFTSPTVNHAPSDFLPTVVATSPPNVADGHSQVIIRVHDSIGLPAEGLSRKSSHAELAAPSPPPLNLSSGSRLGSRASLPPLQLPPPPPQQPVIIANQHMSSRKLPKYRHSHQFERAVRFIQIESLRSDPNVQSFLENLLTFGTQRFPTASSVWILASLCFQHILHNTARAADALQKAKQSVPHIIERWTEFCFMREMEQTKMAESGQSTSALFRNGLDKATKSHETSKAYLKQMWHMLSKEHIDLERIMQYLTRSIDAYWASRAEYNKLLDAYPNSTQVIRGYGCLIRDVQRDDDLAMTLFNTANSMEESLMVSSSEAESFISKASEAQRLQMEAHRRQHKKQNRNRKRKDMHHSALVVPVEKTKNQAVMLKCVLASYSLFIASGIIAAFVITVITFQQCITYTSIIEHSSLIQVSFTNILRELKNWQIFTDPVISSNATLLASLAFAPDLKTITDRLGADTVQLSTTFHLSYLEVPETDFELFEVSEMSMYQITTDTAGAILDIWEQPMNLIDMCYNSFNDAVFVCEFGSVTDVMTHNNLHFVFVGVPVVGVEFVKQLAYSFQQSIGKHTTISTAVTLVICFFIFVYTIFPTSFSYIYFSGHFTTIRRTVFLKFVTAPKQTYTKLKNRLDDPDTDTDTHSAVDFAASLERADTEQVELSEAFGCITREPSEVDMNRNRRRDTVTFKEVSRLVAYSATGMPTDEVGSDEPNPTMASDDFTLHAGKTSPDVLNKLSQEDSFPKQVQNSVEPTGSQDRQAEMLSKQLLTLSRKSSSHASLIQLDPSMFGILSPNQIQGTHTPPQNPLLSESPFAPAPQFGFQRNSSTTGLNPNTFIDSQQASIAATMSEDRESEDEYDEQLESIRERVKTMKGIKPVALRVMLSITVLTTWACLAGVFVTFVVSVESIGYNRNSVFFSFYRTTLLNLIAFLAIQIPYPSTPPPTQFSHSASTRPGPNDFSHINNDPEALQNQMSILLEYFSVLHRKLKEGAARNDVKFISGDEDLDDCKLPRTLLAGSEMTRISFAQTDCLMADKTKCPAGRIVGIPEQFMGLEALITFFASSATNLAQTADAGSTVTLDNPDLMLMLTGLQFDVSGGIELYSHALMDSIANQVASYRQMMIVVSVVCYIVILACTFFFLVPSYKIIRRVADVTTEIERMDPHIDQSLNVITWTDDRMCGLARFDHEHSTSCTAAVNLVQEMDKEPAKRRINRLCADLLIKVFTSLHDEEVMMQKYNINSKQRTRHMADHSQIAQKLVTAVGQMMQNKHGAQNTLIQTLSMWLTHHTQIHDRSLASALEDRMVQSDVAEEITQTKFVIPLSLETFLASYRCPMAVRMQVNHIFAALHLE